MIRVAVVEDEDAGAEALTDCLTRFGGEAGESFHVTRYCDPVEFLERYVGYDLIFMDIRMPNMNGLDAARQLREKDSYVKLVFVTSLAQYAAKGYEVDAMDYIVKPVAYADFSFKMKRILNSLRMVKRHDLMIPQPGGMVRIPSDELLYVEVRGHTLSWHLLDRVLESRGSMEETEQSLSVLGFLRPHNSFLVNPRYIECVQGYTLQVGGASLMISHPRKKRFLEQLGNWYAKGGG